MIVLEFGKGERVLFSDPVVNASAVIGNMAKEAIYWCREAGRVEGKGESEYMRPVGYDYYIGAGEAAFQIAGDR